MTPATVVEDGASGGNRTPVCSLEGCRSTIELHSLWVMSPQVALGNIPQHHGATMSRLGRGAVAKKTKQARHSVATGLVADQSPRLLALAPVAWTPCVPAIGKWWGKQDSNLRRQNHQIYSLTPLAAREFPHSVTRDWRAPTSVENAPASWPRCDWSTKKPVLVHVHPLA